MSVAVLAEEEEEDRVRSTPHWSHSRIDKYLRCPEQYRLYYVEGLRTRLPAASLMFGQVIHQALAALFRTGADPVAFFKESWGNLQHFEFSYAYRESWEKFSGIGQRLLEKFMQEELSRFGSVTAIEESFTLTITNLTIPFVGVIDYIGDIDGKGTILDFKTAGSAYADHEVLLNDQLTAYTLVRPEAEQTALCVFVKTKEPRIEWYFSARRPQDLAEYVAKVEMVARDIAAGHFYKRPGKWCSYCDFLPVCVGDQAKARERLVRIDPH